MAAHAHTTPPPVAQINTARPAGAFDAKGVYDELDRLQQQLYAINGLVDAIIMMAPQLTEGSGGEECRILATTVDQIRVQAEFAEASRSRAADAVHAVAYPR